ncbi:MAG TPA: hypothetical protein VGI63_07340, partial [Verrucomicrobiae bacterium]
EFKKQNLENIDGLMVGYIEYHLVDIKKSCKARHPNRWPVLNQAFEAHDQKKYALSIPVFLAQADGICKDLLGVKFYTRKKGVPATASKASDLEMDFVSDAILEPLRVAGALNAYEDEIDPSSDVLNRHKVLHGSSLDYQTRLNSFRSISLVNYLSAAVSGLQQMKQITPEQIEAFNNEAKKSIEEMLKYQNKNWFSASFDLGYDMIRNLFQKKPTKSSDKNI